MNHINVTIIIYINFQYIEIQSTIFTKSNYITFYILYMVCIRSLYVHSKNENKNMCLKREPTK
jgi:hypothetical protein